MDQVLHGYRTSGETLTKDNFLICLLRPGLLDASYSSRREHAYCSFCEQTSQGVLLRLLVRVWFKLNLPGSSGWIICIWRRYPAVPDQGSCDIFPTGTFAYCHVRYWFLPRHPGHLPYAPLAPPGQKKFHAPLEYNGRYRLAGSLAGWNPNICRNGLAPATASVSAPCPMPLQ